MCQTQSFRFWLTILTIGRDLTCRNEYNIIMKHLWSKINLNQKEWRKIFKVRPSPQALHCLEYLIRNGAPRIVQDLKDDLFKIRTLQDMNYTVEGVDKTAGIREKAKQICELVSEPQRLEEEREFAKKNRDKFRGFSNTDAPSSYQGGSGGYKGFGSEDLQKRDELYRPGAGYDPYKKDSLFAGTTKKEDDKKKKKKKRKKSSSSDSDDSSEKDSDESSDESEKEEKVKRYKKKAKGIEKPAEKKEKKPSKEPKGIA